MKKNGEITVFLSLIFLLLLSFTGAVLESASIQVNKNERRADMSRATESVFAEYQKDLLEEFDIFALDESYETETSSEQNILNRLSLYGAENINSDVEKIRYLSDNSGQEFYRQAVEYIIEKYGMDTAGGLTGNLSVWKEQEKDSEEYEKENDKTSQELEQMLQEGEQELPAENNPVSIISDIRQGNLLDMVLPDGFSLSGAAVRLSELPSHRTLKEGRGEFEEQANTSLSPVFFNLYLIDKFTTAAKKESGVTTENDGLQYEVEYLIGRKASDKENLEAVVRKMVFMRFAPNYAYLLTDEEKQMEAETLSLSLCTLITLPEISKIVKHAILLAWAYGESIMDVRALLGGKKIDLLKTKETWKLSLSALLTLKESKTVIDSSSGDSGYDYGRYLQMLLLLEPKEELAMGGLDLIELRLDKTKNKTFFKVDSCITRIRFQSVCSFRRGITYKFTNEFGYQ